MIKLITREECSYCDQAKTLLKQHNLEYSELQIGKDIEREMVRRLFQSSKVRDWKIYCRKSWDKTVGV